MSDPEITNFGISIKESIQEFQKELLIWAIVGRELSDFLEVSTPIRVNNLAKLDIRKLRVLYLEVSGYKKAFL